eukprot:gene11218-4040_t
MSAITRAKEAMKLGSNYPKFEIEKINKKNGNTVKEETFDETTRLCRFHSDNPNIQVNLHHRALHIDTAYGTDILVMTLKNRSMPSTLNIQISEFYESQVKVFIQLERLVHLSTEAHFEKEVNPKTYITIDETENLFDFMFCSGSYSLSYQVKSSNRDKKEFHILKFLFFYQGVNVCVVESPPIIVDSQNKDETVPMKKNKRKTENELKEPLNKHQKKSEIDSLFGELISIFDEL